MNQGGLKEALIRAFDYLRFKRAINSRRRQLALQIANHYNWQIAFGPFAGMKISRTSWWGQTDLGSKIFGFYESEVLDALLNIDREKYTNFIDLGAADGYYAIGVVYAGLFKKAFSFELSEQGRGVITKNAKLNNVSEKILVFGIADQNFNQLMPDVRLSESVLLVDIEGGEFDLLTNNVLNKLKNSILIIELHEFMVENGQSRLNELIARLQQWFTISWLTTGSRDMSQYEMLEQLNDTDRWLLCSEGRTRLQKWAVCKPLSI